MNYKIFLTAMLVALALGATVMIASAQGPRGGPKKPSDLAGSGFTYQGQLKKSGVALTSTCNFTFTLFADSGGTIPIGSPSETTSVGVANGLFTAQVNSSGEFGATAFNGDARWLQTAVQCTGDGSATTLSPLQRLTPAPMAFALPGLYTQQNATSPNVIGGYSGNVITPTLHGATISGGGLSGLPNRALADYAIVAGGFNNTASGYGSTISGGYYITASGIASTVGGGSSNTARNSYATVGGGGGNTASGYASTVGGGSGNTASGYASTVGGGYQNTASGIGSFVGGGGYDGTFFGANTASGNASTIPGGLGNSATMTYTFAAGRRAKAVNQGAFVWGDSTDADFTSTASNQFLIRAAGGVGINTASPVANTLTVSGSVIAGGTAVPIGTEPFVSEGASSGISMDDRDGSSPRWVMYPSAGTLRFWNVLDRVTISSSGKLTADGGFNGQCLNGTNFNATASSSCNMDMAESFAATELTAPGDLVTLAPARASAPTVRKSPHPYDALLVGVVSQNPGLVFDNGQTHLAGDNSQLITNDKTVVALVGRVSVRVTMENGAISVGDPLTSSSTPGVAMKATRAGKVIGYAMQEATVDGLVLALIQPGYYLPSDAVTQMNAALERSQVVRASAVPLLESNAFGLGAFLLSALALYRTRKAAK